MVAAAHSSGLARIEGLEWLLVLPGQAILVHTAILARVVPGVNRVGDNTRRVPVVFAEVGWHRVPQRSAAPGAPALLRMEGHKLTRAPRTHGADYDGSWSPCPAQQFAREAARFDTSGHVVLLVLPTTYSLSALSSSGSEPGRT